MTRSRSSMMAHSKQLKSKQRVADHGEVFTAEREVNAMLDLVRHETERIDSRFLEPACGDGNFLAEILRRKLAVVRSRYGKSPFDYEKYAFTAVTGLYGVDLLQDNVAECRKRLMGIFEAEYRMVCRNECHAECGEAVRFVLERNILCGDALTMKNIEGEPIIFSEWSIVSETMVKRRDFRLNELLEGHTRQKTFFMEEEGWDYDEETQAFIPAPIQEFPLTEYWKVHES